jgi:general secretion pathway protein N
MIPRSARLSLAGIVAFATAATFVASARAQAPYNPFTDGPAAANPSAGRPAATNSFPSAGRPAPTNPFVDGPATANPVTAGPAVTADLVPAPTRESLPDAKRVITGNPLWAIPLKQLNITRDRPIFTPSRRPPPAVVDRPFVAPPVARAPPPPRPPERPTLALLGTIAGESDGIALFMETTSQMVVRLRTGEAHEGWVLRSVHGREAQLEKGNRTETVTLPDPGSEAPPPEVPQLPPPMDGVRRSPRR